MNSFIEQMQFYATYHQKTITRYTHFIGIPLIIFSIMVFFGFLHLVIPGVLDISFASLMTLVVLGYYYFLNWRIALAVTAFFIILLWFASLVSENGPNSTSLWIFAISFVIGWALQFLGHFFEERGPAFIDNFWQALIAPMYLTAELFFLAGYMRELKMQIHDSESEHTEESTIEDIDQNP